MALISHKVNQQPVESKLKRRRGLTLAALERRTKLRKQTKKAAKPKTSVVKMIGHGLQSFNRGLAKQSSKMPGKSDFSSWMWK